MKVRNKESSIKMSTLSPSAEGPITKDNPLRVMIAGAGIGGLTLANSLSKHANVEVTVFERTSEFKRFGGPIQLASNALQLLKEMDGPVYNSIMENLLLLLQLKSVICHTLVSSNVLIYNKFF